MPSDVVFIEGGRDRSITVTEDLDDIVGAVQDAISSQQKFVVLTIAEPDNVKGRRITVRAADVTEVMDR